MDEVSLTDMGKKGAPDMYWTNWRGLIQTGYTKKPPIYSWENSESIDKFLADWRMFRRSSRKN